MISVLVLGLILILIIKENLKSKCPKCRFQYSDCFIWDGKRYCFPCWVDDGIVRFE